MAMIMAALFYTSVARAASDTISVFFPFNESILTDEARALIDSAIYVGVIPSTHSLAIIGYADAVGTDSFNLHLSRQRAGRVKDYLVQSGYKAQLITLITGKGEHGAAPEITGGTLKDRRVDIVRVERPKDRSNVIRMADLRVPTVPGVAPPTPHQPRKASETNLGTVAVGETLLLDNIYFYAGRHVVRPESYPSLEDLAKALIDHPDVRIRVEGHVCCVPSSARDAIDDDTGLEELSLMRALAIRDYLIRKGIAPDRLRYAGFGKKYPLIPVERTEEDANQNRRVEIRVVK
jgi:outer membrane protein OmpA-like peptidoglycan-associated protein